MEWGDSSSSSLEVPAPGSVTRWILNLKAGDQEAAYEIWRRYFRRLVGLAEDKLKKLSYHSGAADEEDVAASAFHSLCDGALKGKFDLLVDRNDLWRLLVVITSRKAADLSLREARKKRGEGRVYNEGEMNIEMLPEANALDNLPSGEKTPEFAALLAEEYETRLQALGRKELRRIAVLRMEGYRNEEIAEVLGCALRTVARRLEMIRSAWSAEDPWVPQR